MARGVQAVTDLELMESAREARTRAYVEYSGYAVGAALLAGGEVHTGANIEVSGRSTSVHAEMMAAYNAVLAKTGDFQVLAISPQGETGEAPCGLCQHTIAQFCDELRIIEDVGKDDDFVEYELSELIGPAYNPSTRPPTDGEDTY